MDRHIAIDFGTTTTVVAYQDREDGRQNKVELVNFSGNRYVPTVVLREGTITDKKGREVPIARAFGWDAANKTVAHSLLQSDLKMGLISEDPVVQENARDITKAFFAYLHEHYGNKTTSLKGVAYEETTIVTYPAKFPQEVQAFLKQAAEESGFRNVELLDEAKAAMAFSLHYETGEIRQYVNGLGKKTMKVMLIDMGAGTTDISLFAYDTADPTRFSHLCSWPEEGGINFGGSQIDSILCDFYEKKMRSDLLSVLGAGNSRLGREILRSDVKKFKESFSEEVKSGVVSTPCPPMLYRYGAGEEEELDQEAFEELLKEYLPKFPELVTGALNKANLESKDVDLVLLTGGHSQWYFVQDMLKELGFAPGAVFGFEEPHLVVAQGAAVYTEPEVTEEGPFDLEADLKAIAKAFEDFDEEMYSGSFSSVNVEVFEKEEKGVSTDSTAPQVEDDPGQETDRVDQRQNNQAVSTEKNDIFPLKYDPKSLIRPVIATFEKHILAVKSDGCVLVTGSNSDGQRNVQNWKDIVSVAAGAQHSVGLRNDGMVLAVGSNSKGQCDVHNWKNIVAIAAGKNCTIGLRSDGTVVAAGISKRKRNIVAAWTSVVAITASRTDDDIIYGLRDNGELCMSKAFSKRKIIKEDVKTVRILNTNGDLLYLTHKGKVNHPNLQGLDRIVAIDSHRQIVALKEDGTAVAFGSSNINHELDVSDWNSMIAIAAGNLWTIGLQADGIMRIAYKKTIFDPKSPANEISGWKLF